MISTNNAAKNIATILAITKAPNDVIAIASEVIKRDEEKYLSEAMKVEVLRDDKDKGSRWAQRTQHYDKRCATRNKRKRIAKQSRKINRGK